MLSAATLTAGWRAVPPREPGILEALTPGVISVVFDVVDHEAECLVLVQPATPDKCADQLARLVWPSEGGRDDLVRPLADIALDGVLR